MLELYERRCPPGGKNSVIVYKTSGGNKKAIEDFNEIVFKFHLEQIEFTVRDIYEDLRFRNELAKVLGKKDVKAPVVSVKGRLIGGLDEVEKLSYEELAILFHGIPKKYKEESDD
ncbi:hypothetical protein IFM89_027877 [Coptis chinensis]|uniref:Glutaredoxin n=1 Tax=Coptis chinensis TaxID=261450 RepID=A0A835HHG6_9MAGN|nr:hypothetical protein IFM89_027877 [Coptis chinensis]